LKLIIYFIGVTKCFGEALGRYMGEHEELPTIVVRIGAYQPHTSLKDDNKTGLIMNAWLSEPDAVQLFERCIENSQSFMVFQVIYSIEWISIQHGNY
jgi:hypothetical protein